MKKIVVILMTILLLAFGGMTIWATSDTLDELKELEEAQKARQEELAEKQKQQEKRKKEQQNLLNEIEEQFDVIESRLEAGNSALKELYVSIGALEKEIVTQNLSLDEIELSLEEKQSEIEDVKLELKQIRMEKERLHAQAMERIRVMYEYGDTGYLEVLVSSDDLMDMFSRLEYINRLVEADNDLFSSLNAFETDITAKESSLEIHEATLEELRAEVLVEKAALEEKVISKNLEVERANTLMNEQKAYQQTLSEEESQTEAVINEIQKTLDQIEEEEARVDEELRLILAKKAAEIARISGLDYDGGMILWPVPGWSRISSPFGPRFHPIQQVWKNHNGIDIPATSGTPIIAVMSGEVIISKYSSSYGNYCAIAHGNGYVSLYAHASALLVSVGDKVEAGETIAKVGTTGWSTGNHLHFGFQKNEVWVDPMDYFN